MKRKQTQKMGEKEGASLSSKTKEKEKHVGKEVTNRNGRKGRKGHSKPVSLLQKGEMLGERVRKGGQFTSRAKKRS